MWPISFDANNFKFSIVPRLVIIMYYHHHHYYPSDHYCYYKNDAQIRNYPTHVPFAQRIVCEPHQYVNHSTNVARVHSFTTRVYVNREPYPLVQRHSSTLLRRPPSFAYRYHSAERPIKRLVRTFKVTLVSWDFVLFPFHPKFEFLTNNKISIQ